VDEASSTFLEHFEKHRTTKEITWIMKNPWVLEGNNVEKDYLFSSYAKEFKYFWVEDFCTNMEILKHVPYLICVMDI
jgi:hypothetical protein